MYFIVTYNNSYLAKNVCLWRLHANLTNIYSKTCLIWHLCNPFPCVIQHWISCPFLPFSVCFTLCHPTPYLFRQTFSLLMHVGLDRFQLIYSACFMFVLFFQFRPLTRSRNSRFILATPLSGNIVQKHYMCYKSWYSEVTQYYLFLIKVIKTRMNIYQPLIYWIRKEILHWLID